MFKRIVMDFLDKKTQKYIFIAIFILYILLVFIVGYHHEPWADEAQSWLISRDFSFLGIFQETKYEGHPFVWFYIVRLFIKILSPFINAVQLYNWIFIIPLVFSSIGVYLLLFKSKLPFWVKIASPFTFYIFYQCGIIARNHSLCFTILAIIAVFYKKRLEHPFIYILLLILNANISAYLYPVSIVLLIFFFIDYYKNAENKLLYHLSFLTGLLFLGLTAVHMYNPQDCYFWQGVHYGFDNMVQTLKHIARIYFPIQYSRIFFLFSLVMTGLLYWTLMKAYCKNIYQTLFFLALNIPLYIVYNFIYIQYWHYAYAFIFLLFTCWILADLNDIENIPFKKNFLLYILTVFILGYNIFENIRISYFDCNYYYSGSKAAAEFIQKYDLQDYKIIGLGMKTVAVQPYFDKNLYYNYIGVNHFSWHLYFFNEYNKRRQKDAPIIIYTYHDFVVNDALEEYNTFLDNIKDNYNKYSFKGKMQGINFDSGNSEENSYDIYIDKNLANKLDITEDTE